MQVATRPPTGGLFVSQDSTSNYISAAASLQGLVIPSECAAGVRANMTLFLGHADIVAAADDFAAEPAEMLRP